MKDISSADAYKIWVLLHQTATAVLKAREQELSGFGISAAQAAILFVVHTIGDRATPTEISRLIFRKPHTVSGLVSKMEKKGLVKKVKDLGRKNLVRVILTEEGQQAYRNSSIRESILQIMSSLSREQRQQLESYLQTLRNRAIAGIAIDHKPFYGQS